MPQKRKKGKNIGALADNFLFLSAKRSQENINKDVFLLCGNTSYFHFLRSNGILWVTPNTV